MEKYFDHIISSNKQMQSPPVRNIADLLFNPLPHRDEDSDIILSHDGNTLITVSLNRLRSIVYNLYGEFNKKGIKPGDTICLASMPGNNELFIAIMYAALSSYGSRVLIPMFMETRELDEWLELTDCQAIILSGREIFTLNHHVREKTVVRSVKAIADKRSLLCLDLWDDFDLKHQLYEKFPVIDFSTRPSVKSAIEKTSLDTEVTIITTSGSTNRSKMVAYDQGGFLKNCMSWQAAGFYDKKNLGGRGFTPLFTHTMGIRAFFNALWTGSPMCLIVTEWFREKPETVRYLLLRMQPEHITGGPSVYNLLLELMRSFTELKVQLRPHFRTLISSGAPLSSHTSGLLKSAFGITMHNAYGTTETQQVLSTLLYDSPDNKMLQTLGLPLP